MSDAELAEIEALYIWQIDCGDLDFKFQDMAGKMLQALKTDRDCLTRIQDILDDPSERNMHDDIQGVLDE